MPTTKPLIGINMIKVQSYVNCSTFRPSYREPPRFASQVVVSFGLAITLSLSTFGLGLTTFAPNHSYLPCLKSLGLKAISQKCDVAPYVTLSPPISNTTSPKLVKMSDITTFEVMFEKLYLLQSPILLPKTC